jgi:hypothetical protein
VTQEQKEALCEYVDGLRASGRRYDEIAETLAGKLPEEDLGQLEVWHRKWQKKEWREEVRRQKETVPIGETDIPDTAAEGEEWSAGGDEGQRELVRYLAQRLLRHEVTDGGGKVRWVPLYTRSLAEGQTCEGVKGAGQAAGCRWFRSAVIFRTATRVDHVEVEARIRQRIQPGTTKALSMGLTKEAVCVEKLYLVRERLDHAEICAKLAALLQTFLGRGSGIKSGAHLARITDRTRQAVSIRKLRIAADYYKKTGGRAGFEGLSSAARRRLKVLADAQNENRPPV